jgi:hypothetical protein
MGAFCERRGLRPGMWKAEEAQRLTKEQGRWQGVAASRLGGRGIVVWRDWRDATWKRSGILRGALGRDLLP